jgi:isoleucyl-tRNA synthetase
VFDCWFESGCVPYAQIHYPFNQRRAALNHETRSIIDNDNEALCDFICEGIDQTRGWFYTLHVISTALFNKPAFKNVVCAGLILASDGKKMSKRLGNFVDPKQIIADYGGDALRMYMLHLPATYAESSRFKEEDIKAETKTIMQWINSIKFLIEHIKMYEGISTQGKFPIITPSNLELKNMSDIWIISRLNTCIQRVNDYMSQYEFTKYIDEVFDFIEDYTNWYLKFNRSRLKGKEGNQDWIDSLNTCVYVANQFNLVCTPIAPFLSHTIQLNLQKTGISYYISESALLETFPTENKSIISSEFEHSFKLFQQIADMIRTMRSQVGLSSVKVPIKSVTIYLENPSALENMREYFFSDEMNILNVEIKEQVEPEITLTMKPAYGKLYRADYPKIKNHLLTLNVNNTLLSAGYIELFGHTIPMEQLTINKKSTIQLKANEVISEQNGMSVVLDKTQDDEVKIKHFTRMLIYNTQRIRKASSLRPWNKISFLFTTFSDRLNQWIEMNQENIENSLGYPVIYNSIENAHVYANDSFKYDDEEINVIIYGNTNE